MQRLFFAVHPDADAALRIAALVQSLRRPLGLRSRAIAGERSHVTLLFVGSWAQPPVGVVEKLLEAGSAVALTDVAPFDLQFDRVASFNRRPSNRPIVLLSDPAGPVARLHARLAEELRSRGVPFDVSASYTPHLTLMYDDAKVDPQPVEGMGWTVREFALMQSLVGMSTHRVLGRWPLGGA
jgi:RNA 2',3'-cyclic 3'-phosphodiesterase